VKQFLNLQGILYLANVSFLSLEASDFSDLAFAIFDIDFAIALKPV